MNTQNKDKKTDSWPRWLWRIVRLVASEWWVAFAWTHGFVIRTLLRKEPNTGPISIAICALTFPVLPLAAASFGVGNVLIALDRIFPGKA